MPSLTAAEAQSDESGQSNTDDLPNQLAARHHAHALRELFDRALDDNVSEQVSALVNAVLDDHWQSFFHRAQEYCDGVVERAEEGLRGWPCRLHPPGGWSHCQGHERESFRCGPGSDRCVVSPVAGLVVIRSLAPPLRQQPIAVPFSRVWSTRGNGHEHLQTMAKLMLSRSS